MIEKDRRKGRDELRCLGFNGIFLLPLHLPSIGSIDVSFSEKKKKVPAGSVKPQAFNVKQELYVGRRTPT